MCHETPNISILVIEVCGQPHYQFNQYGMRKISFPEEDELCCVDLDFFTAPAHFTGQT